MCTISISYFKLFSILLSYEKGSKNLDFERFLGCSTTMVGAYNNSNRHFLWWLCSIRRTRCTLKVWALNLFPGLNYLESNLASREIIIFACFWGFHEKLHISRTKHYFMKMFSLLIINMLPLFNLKIRIRNSEVDWAALLVSLVQ